MDCSPPGSSVQEYSLGKNTGVRCHGGIFATQGSNLSLLHCRWIFYCWATWEAPTYQRLSTKPESNLTQQREGPRSRTPWALQPETPGLASTHQQADTSTQNPWTLQLHTPGSSNAHQWAHCSNGMYITNHQMQIKTTMRYHLTPVRMAFIKKVTDKCWWGCGKKGLL